jgi:hypothetical protein
MSQKPTAPKRPASWRLNSQTVPWMTNPILNWGQGPKARSRKFGRRQPSESLLVGCPTWSV